MAVSEKGSAKFTWQIENFSMCPQNFGEYIESPLYVAECLEKTHWQLRIFPRGCDDQNYLACILVRTDDDNYAEDIAVGYSFIMHSVARNEITEIETHQVFEERRSRSCNFCTTEHLLNVSNGYLPNDTLTVSCHIWRAKNTTVVNNSTLLKKLFIVFTREELFGFRSSKVISRASSVLSRVEVEKKSILWPIRKFSKLRDEKNVFLPVTVIMKDGSSYSLTLYLTADYQSNLTIEIHGKKSDRRTIHFAKCKIMIISTTIEVRHTKEVVWNLGTNICKFPLDIPSKELSSESVTEPDTLYLVCDFAFSTHQNLSHVNRTDLSHLTDVTQTSLNSVVSMLKQSIPGEVSKFSHVVLRTGDRNFKVSKADLTAMSPVFSAMFEHDTTEKKTGIVDITDVDSDTMDLMLDFMCTGFLEKMNIENAVNLYTVSEKYQVLPLKWFCSCALKFSMSVSNVCSIVVLANLHRDADLMDDALNFIRINEKGVLSSQSWKDLMASNRILTGEIMYNILTERKD